MGDFIDAVEQARSKKPIEFLTLVVAFLTLVVAAVSGGVLVWQLWALNDALDSQAYNYIDSGLIHIDDTFVKEAKLRPFFVQNKSVPEAKPENEETRQKLWALADLQLDFIDGFFTQENHIDWQRYSNEAWRIYFGDSFKCSAVLREAFCRHESQYGKTIREFVRSTFPPRLCEHGKPRANLPAPDCPEE